MKKTILKRIIIISCVAVFVLCVCAFRYPIYERYFYGGDRITLKISASADGKACSLDASSVDCTYENRKKESVHRDGNNFSVRGNEYGMYDFNILTGKYTVKVRLMHTNWYEINSADLKFNIDTKTEKMTYKLNETEGTLKPEKNGKTYNLYYMF